QTEDFHSGLGAENRLTLVIYANLLIARSWAFCVSTSRLRGGAVVLSEWTSLLAAAVTSSTAVLNASSFTREGLLVPLNLRTNCKADARTSSVVAGCSKLARVSMFLHMV